MSKLIAKAPSLPDSTVADAQGIISRFRETCDTTAWSMAQSMLEEAQAMLNARRSMQPKPFTMPENLREDVRKGLTDRGFNLTESWSPSYGNGFDDMMLTRAMTYGIGGKELSLWMTMRLEYYRGQARYMYETNPHYHGLIEAPVNFCVGDNPAVSFTPREKGKKDSPAAKAAKDYWDRKLESSDFNWMELCSELVRRCERDGEVGPRRISVKDDISGIKVKKEGKPVYWRFMEPDYILEPTGKAAPKDKSYTYGIITPVDDAQTIEGFWYCPGGDPSKPIEVEAADVVWLKIGTDGNVKRGRPGLFAVTPELRSMAEFRNDRKILNRVRTAIALVIKSGTSLPGQQSARAEKHRTGSVMTSSADSSGTITQRAVNTQQLQPGSIIYTGKDDEHEFLNPSTGADEAATDYRLMALAVCAGVQFPEYMVSWDSSNSNLASHQVSKAPAIINMRRKQRMYAAAFAEIVWRDMEAGMPNCPSRSDLNVLVSQPDIDPQDPEAKVNETATLIDKKLMSRTTGQVRHNLDPDIEDQQIEADNIEPPDAAAELLDRPAGPKVGKGKKAAKPK